MDYQVDFQFDEWAALARTNPSAFEARCLALLERCLGEAGPSVPAYALVRLRAILRTEGQADSPLERAAQAFNLMLASTHELVDTHNALASDMSIAPVERPSLPAAQRYARFVAR